MIISVPQASLKMMAAIGRITVILNPSSGPDGEGAHVEAVRNALRSAGVADAEVVLLEPGVVLQQVIADQTGRGANAVIAAGGDGTVSAVAAALAETETPLGILPAGTFNHFAKDLGIPVELDDAARIIAAGHTVRVDVAKVNGRVFVNNSSIGFYPAMVSAREDLMRKGWPKRIAAPVGVLTALRRFPNTSVRLITGNDGLVTRTPFVFVGNNIYRFSGPGAGTRDRLQDGVLQICTVQNPTRLALLRTLALAMTGNTNATPDLLMATAKEARIVTLRKRVRVALDGEVIILNSPLIYSICPAALRVLVPRES